MNLPTNDHDDSSSGPGWPFRSHPVWCIRSEDTDQEHVGRAVDIDSLVGFASIRAQLRRGRHPAAVPTVVISDGTARISITPSRAGRWRTF